MMNVQHADISEYMALKDKIQYSVDLLLKCEEMALRMDPENGFYLAFSGGKDSQVLYHLALQAGVKFKAHMNLTSVDPPEVIRFVKKNYPDVELIKPRMSIYEMAKIKGIVPTRIARWCCEEFKEMSGAGKVTLIGIRKSESVRRSKRNEIETGDRKFSGTFDQVERTSGKNGDMCRWKRQNTGFSDHLLDRERCMGIFK